MSSKTINTVTQLTKDNLQILKNITAEYLFVLKQMTRSLKNGAKIPKLTSKQHEKLMGILGRKKGRFTLRDPSNSDRMVASLAGKKRTAKRKNKTNIKKKRKNKLTKKR